MHRKVGKTIVDLTRFHFGNEFACMYKIVDSGYAAK